MTIFARNPDNGQAKWVYQMTPHDEWDYDGVNEMILADQQIGGQARKLLVHFDRNGLGYTLDRDTGELLVAEKYDPVVNWTSGVVLTLFSAIVLTLIILVPVRPSRENAISMPSVRRSVCARRSRPASARGF
jgi:glucose dehydrogenase